MTPLEQQRLAIALVHVVDGAAVTLECERGERVVVARHPAADLSPCAMRRAFLTARPRTLGCSPFDRVVDLELGGSLIELGAGVVGAQTADGRLHRWIATTLDARACVELLEHLDENTDGVEATISPDVELGATVVRLSADRCRLGIVERAAVAAAASMITAELIGGLTTPSTRGR